MKSVDLLPAVECTLNWTTDSKKIAECGSVDNIILRKFQEASKATNYHQSRFVQMSKGKIIVMKKSTLYGIMEETKDSQHRLH